MSYQILAITENLVGGETIATNQLLAAVAALDQPVNQFELTSLRQTGFVAYCWWIISNSWRAAQAIWRQRTVDVVYTTTYLGVLGALLVRPFGNFQIYFHYHGNRIPPQPSPTWPWLRRLTQRFKHHLVKQLHHLAWQAVDVFITPSQSSQALLTKQFQLGKSQLIIPNGVDVQRFQPLSETQRHQLRKQFHIPQRAFVCASISRLDPQKKILETIELVKQLQASCRRQLLLIIAAPSRGNDADYLARIEQLLTTAEIPHYLVYDFPKMEKIYQLSDCVLTSSTQEVFPLVLLESAATGVPYFAKKNGVIETYLRQIDDALLLAENTQQATRQILANTHKRKLSAKLRQFAVGHTWQASAIGLLYNIEQKQPVHG